MNSNTFFTILLHWWQENKRDLPWKNTSDPYKIWISEIILQQTRVSQGTAYYEKFIEAFPDVVVLANAKEDDVMKKWEGLGYYSRARNIHTTAKLIVQNNNGIFPDSYEEIIKLKGIGPYTASAIASFAFHLPYAVVDGNVIRIISRLQGIYDIIESKSSQKLIQTFVTEAIIDQDSASFNQAIMDFGSKVCLPQNPDCPSCPLNKFCIAHNDNTTHLIPVKNKKAPKKQRYFHYFDIAVRETNNIIIQLRTEKDIWQKLYQFPLTETDNAEILNHWSIEEKLKEILSLEEEISFKLQQNYQATQLLTHQKINVIIYKLLLFSPSIKINQGYNLVERRKVSNFAFPKIISEYINSYHNQLSGEEIEIC